MLQLGLLDWFSLLRLGQRVTGLSSLLGRFSKLHCVRLVGLESDTLLLEGRGQLEICLRVMSAE